MMGHRWVEKRCGNDLLAGRGCDSPTPHRDGAVVAAVMVVVAAVVGSDEYVRVVAMMMMMTMMTTMMMTMKMNIAREAAALISH